MYWFNFMGFSFQLLVVIMVFPVSWVPVLLMVLIWLDNYAFPCLAFSFGLLDAITVYTFAPLCLLFSKAKPSVKGSKVSPAYRATHRPAGAGGTALIPKARADLIFVGVADKKAVRTALANRKYFVYVLTCGNEEYAGSTARGYDRVEAYLSMDRRRISTGPFEMLRAQGQGNVVISIYFCETEIAAKALEQSFFDAYTCSLNISRTVNMDKLDTGFITVYVFDKVQGTTKMFPSMTDAAEALGISRQTVMRAVDSGKEVRGCLTISKSPDIIVKSATAPNSGRSVYVYKNGRQLPQGSFYKSVRSAAQALGFHPRVISENLDKNTAYQGYSFYSSPLTDTELGSIEFTVVQVTSPAKIWVYRDGALVEGSPFVGARSAAKAASTSHTTVYRHLDKGADSVSDRGFTFYTSPLG